MCAINATETDVLCKCVAWIRACALIYRICALIYNKVVSALREVDNIVWEK